MNKLLISFLSTLVFMFVLTTPVSAHVVVKPSEVKVAERLNFIVGVPTEKEIPTTGVRLVIPDGLESVRPLVKSGWRVEIVHDESGEKVTEIIWSGGQVPAEQKDEFTISAKAPATEGELVWKAYQTYSDGTVVSWDAMEESDEENVGPHSTTMVINDLAMEPESKTETSSSLPLFLSGAALLISVATFVKSKK